MKDNLVYLDGGRERCFRKPDLPPESIPSGGISLILRWWRRYTVIILTPEATS